MKHCRFQQQSLLTSLQKKSPRKWKIKGNAAANTLVIVEVGPVKLVFLRGRVTTAASSTVPSLIFLVQREDIWTKYGWATPTLGNVGYSYIQVRESHAQQHGCPLGNWLQRKRAEKSKVGSEGKCLEGRPQNCAEHDMPMAGHCPSQVLTCCGGCCGLAGWCGHMLRAVKPLCWGAEVSRKSTNRTSLPVLPVCLCQSRSVSVCHIESLQFLQCGDLLNSCTLKGAGWTWWALTGKCAHKAAFWAVLYRCPGNSSQIAEHWSYRCVLSSWWCKLVPGSLRLIFPLSLLQPLLLCFRGAEVPACWWEEKGSQSPVPLVPGHPY